MSQLVAARRAGLHPLQDMGNSVDIQRAFESVPGLFLILATDPQFTIVGASNDYLRATHTDRSIFGRPVFDVFPDNPDAPGADGVNNLRTSFQRVVATGVADAMPVQRYDVARSAAEGGGFEERYWSPVNSPVLRDDGTVQYIVQRVEDATAKANRNSVQILESLTEGFFTLDRQWRFDYVNHEAHRILGEAPGSLSGRTLWEVYPGLEGTDFERRYRVAMHDREKTSFTAYYAAHERWYEVTAYPAPEGISVYFRNVTEQQTLQAEREVLIAESERQRLIYETALDNTPDFVYVFDTDHRAMYANAALMKTWGVTDVRGKRWMDLGYEQWHADMHDRELDQVIRTRAPIRGEIPFTGTNGTRVYDYIFAPVLGDDGEVVAVAGTTRDITERQAVERAATEHAERLAETDRAKDEFLATLSHELRNPLAPLRTSIEVLRRTEAGDGRVQRVHAVMERQIAQLIRLVDDLLEVSRISRGVFSLRKERVDVATVVRNAVEASDSLLKAAGHQLQVDLPEAPLLLDADPVRLTQILVNLLNNAASYSDRPGRVTVRARRDGTQAVISVRDDGIGIAPDALPKLFAMFSRGDFATPAGRERRGSATKQAGLGIGLALSRKLADMHGGTLDAVSAGLGQGSEFTVRLPLLASDVIEPARSVTPDGGLAHLRVLVVDDNHDAAEALAMALASLDADVHTAHNGPDALRTYDTLRPHAVLLDIGMPGMSGHQVAQAIRSGFPDHTATLIALTGWGQRDDRERAREAGFDHHLVKPAELDDIVRLLGGTDATLRP